MLHTCARVTSFPITRECHDGIAKGNFTDKTQPWPGWEIKSATPLYKAERLLIFAMPIPFLFLSQSKPTPLSETERVRLFFFCKRRMTTFVAFACFKILLICSCMILKIFSLDS